MALTDADRLQMTALALMQHSVFTLGSGGSGLGEFIGAINIRAITGYFPDTYFFGTVVKA